MEKISHRLEGQQGGDDKDDLVEEEDVSENQPINPEIPIEAQVPRIQETTSSMALVHPQFGDGLPTSQPLMSTSMPTDAPQEWTIVEDVFADMR